MIWLLRNAGLLYVRIEQKSELAGVDYITFSVHIFKKSCRIILETVYLESVFLLTSKVLEVVIVGARSALDEQLQVALEELTDLKGVWNELAGIWEQIDILKDQAWVSISPKKLRQSLETLMTQLKNMPARLRQYESYDHVQRVLKQYSKMNMLIVELKADYLKDRHWKSLMKKLRVNWVMSDLTLGHVWDIDLSKHENDIREVLSVAQGENALEEFLKQVCNGCIHKENL